MFVSATLLAAVLLRLGLRTFGATFAFTTFGEIFVETCACLLGCLPRDLDAGAGGASVMLFVGGLPLLFGAGAGFLDTFPQL